MNHNEFMEAVESSKATEDNQIENNTPEEMNGECSCHHHHHEDPDMFTIRIPMITGRVFKVDARQVDWDAMGTPESQANLEQNEGIIRSMVHSLITADFSDPKIDEMIKDFDESINNLFSNFGIDDPGYNELQKNIMVKPYVLLLGKCFDALTLINVIAHNTAMHSLATQVFGITDEFKHVANLNDITEMDNSVDGLISEDRHAFEGVSDEHNASGLLGD